MNTHKQFLRDYADYAERGDAEAAPALADLQAACLAGADAIAALTSERSQREAAERERDEARETAKRLNRRWQIADAAAALQAEKWDQRSKGQGRAYIWDLARWKYEGDIEALTAERDSLTAALAERTRERDAAREEVKATLADFITLSKQRDQWKDAATTAESQATAAR